MGLPAPQAQQFTFIATNLRTSSFTTRPPRTAVATTQSAAYSLARSIQDFHMDSNGWIDTGQNFTVSRGGYAMEGRHRSLETFASRHQFCPWCPRRRRQRELRVDRHRKRRNVHLGHAARCTVRQAHRSLRIYLRQVRHRFQPNFWPSRFHGDGLPWQRALRHAAPSCAPLSQRSAPAAAFTTIVDNSTAGRFTASSNWGTSSFSDQGHGPDYRFANPVAASDPAWYKVNIPSTGAYLVDAWYPADPGYNDSTPYVIVTSSGNQTVTVNQQPAAACGITWARSISRPAITTSSA